MSALFTPGLIAGLLGVVAALSIAFGYPALGAFLTNPDTAQHVTALVAAVLALIAGFSRGPGQPPPPPKA